MSKEQAREDFGTIVGGIKRTLSDVKILAVQIDHVKKLKEEILDDTTRKAEVKKIVDVMLDESLTEIVAKYDKLITLRGWLEQNGLL